MPDILEGQLVEVQGSARLPYVLKNIGGVYSCSCPAWRNQSRGIEARSCKHLRSFRGEHAEAARIGRISSAPVTTTAPTKAPPLLLAQTWTPLCTERGWWMSEKLDGIRAYWHGHRFLSRLGNVYLTPDWF